VSNSKIRRRDFLRSTAGALGSLAIVNSGLQSQADETPPPDGGRPAIGCIGLGDRGIYLAHQATRFGRIVAVCDVDLNRARRARESLAPKAGVYQDYRRLLDRNDVDVIINATPDHWHTLVNVSACRAGKDVYTEKPLTLTIDEGKILRRVVGQTGRIVQVGTQQRSTPQFQTAVELVRNGRLGKLKQVWVAVPFCSTKGGPFPKEAVPDDLDWDLYQGQTPEHDYCHWRTHAVFRWWYEYAGGIVTDWGNHHVDVAHWGMDCESTGPVSVDARGLFPNQGRADCYNTADRFLSRMVYPGGIEMLYFAAMGDRQRYGAVEKNVDTSPEELKWLFGEDVPEEIKTLQRNGVMFIGEQGRVFVNRGGLYGKAADELEENPLPPDAWRAAATDDAPGGLPKDPRSAKVRLGDCTDRHMANFFACVASRRQPVSTVALQHRTVTACHLTNISLRLNRKLRWDPIKEEIVGDDEARGWQARAQREPYTIPG